MQNDHVIKWLLEGDVAIQFQVHRDLLGNTLPELQQRIKNEGWGKAFLEKRNPNGHWGQKYYQPKWISTHYTLLDLKNLQIGPDPTRRAILLLLASQSLTAGAIAANFDTARPTVSKHLQILTECELLTQEPKGREVFYQLNPSGMKEVADFIEPFRQMWDERFDRLEAIMKNLKNK